MHAIYQQDASSTEPYTIWKDGSSLEGLSTFCADHLQGLTTDEVRPGANLARDAIATGELLVHALSEQLSSL